MRELERMDLAACVRRLPRDVADQLHRRPRLFVAGGFVRAVVANEQINDIDVFAPDQAYAQEAANELAALRHTKVHATDNAFTVPGRLSVQYIHRWPFEFMTDCIRSFDFTVAKAGVGWDRNENTWFGLCDDHFYADLAARRLVYTSPQRNEDAGGSMIRVLKFYQRGYRIPLDSLAAVVARLVQGVDMAKVETSAAIDNITREQQLAKVLTGLLREVDPNSNPDRYLAAGMETPDDNSNA